MARGGAAATGGLRVVVTGGGSGGHITPVLAVAHALKQLRPDCQVIYVGQTGDGLGDIPSQDAHIDRVYTVRAGKLRRYHGEGLKQLLDVPTLARNVRDAGYVVLGLLQSYRLLRRLRPHVVFVKGGFVGVPVGLAAAVLGIPYVTHDSDAIPGLANRIIARWAAKHAVALPKEVYGYPASKTVTVGVPIASRFRRYPADELRQLRQRLGLPAEGRAVLVAGGGLGAQRLNRAVADSAAELLAAYPDLTILHQAGRSQQAEVREKYNELLAPELRQRVQVYGFVSNMDELAAVADLVITRAGATNMAEFAAMAKPCIVVPNPQLTGGHQTKNAQALAGRQAVQVVEEAAIRSDQQLLGRTVRRWLDDPAAARQMAERLHELAQPDAAHHLAVLLLDEAGQAGQTGQSGQADRRQVD